MYRKKLPAYLSGREVRPEAEDQSNLGMHFWRGASIDDRSGRLGTSGEVMAHAQLRELDDVDAPLFADWLRQPRGLELAASE